MNTKPIVLHTEDNEEYVESTIEEFAQLGITVESFTKNELAFEAAKQKALPNEPYYDAVLADYNTESNMKGAELIAALIKSNLEGKPLVKEVLVLSSSADRHGILDSLKDALAKQHIEGSIIDKYMDSIQVFDKTYERRLAELYVAIHSLFPEEAREIKRVEMIQWAGFKVDDGGYLKHKDLFSLDPVIGKKFELIQKNQLTLPEITREIILQKQLGEGRPPGMIK